MKTYEQNAPMLEPKKYEAALIICRQYKVLLASLDKYERKLFEHRIINSKAIRFFAEGDRIAFGIILKNWQEIFFL